ncbi:phosphotriesterase family protein [Micromonospora endophytica]|uniref:Phosphotriesterase n=1 Tax=Micromonospora endophytica TaxID=515350 RepID=A0A2W2CVT2_9ACTN|nr:phosphotriesterase [Micromonospora endophytica]PZF92067.1 phosphotriesterase [Micromonospora endophytica]RIW51370.1 phosphotriesterase [Micromonospora endophytica]BCJ62058.1 aryldialkylphosphatase [Micromonospora endophytica]
MPIQTVLGPIAPEQLGPTSMHEHLLSDLSLWSKPPRELPPADVPMGPELAAYLRWNALSLKENLILDDPRVAAEELAHVRAAGGSAVVELTLEGMGRRIGELPEISRRAGVHVCVGAGFYVEETMPAQVRQAGVDDLTELLVAQLTDGIGDSGIRPALLGEIGTSWPITAAEWRMVRAAGRAGARTGAAVYMHLSFRGSGGTAVLAALLEEGMPADRVIIGHLDERWDRGYHREVAQAGAMLGYDTFGSDFYYGSAALRNPTDAERLDMVEWLLSEGFGAQLVIAADVWTQANLRRNGGNGYDHLFRRIGPAIADLAAGAPGIVDTIMVDTPRRLLDRP